MNLAAVMDEIATQLDTITELRAYGYPPETIVPPVAIVDFPESIDYDQTYGRGADRMSLLVWVVAGRATAPATRDLLAAYADGSGARSVKAVIEAGTYTAFDEAVVTGAEFEPVTYNGATYLAAQFTVDIMGSGS